MKIVHISGCEHRAKVKPTYPLLEVIQVNTKLLSDYKNIGSEHETS